VFASYGSREGGFAAAKTSTAGLKAADINASYYESPLTAHEFQTWRRSLREFAQLLFKD
jgi:enterochelin esterase family protein